ncbi:MAG: alpha/beta fold hydrolase [Sulfurimonas sp.]
MKRVILRLLLLLFFLTNIYAEDREEALCGTFFEPFVFWVWSSMTPKPNSSIVANIPFIEPSQYKTSDGKTLRGYRYLSNNGYAKTSPKGYILVAMGNTMVSDQMIVMLKSFSLKGYDVYVYDYRGYANSEGARRIKAIIEDYEEIAKTLNKTYKKKLLYGISLGGAVMLNIIGSGLEYDAAVIDSAPSFLSPFGCPKSIDPLQNLPKDADKIFLITAQKDSVLPKSMTSPLRESAQERGAKTLDAEEYEHPFADRDLEIHYKRMSTILEFLDTK